MDDRQILESIICLYDDVRADWLPSTELCQRFRETFDYALAPADISRMMKPYGERTATRMYNSKQTWGYARRQFAGVLDKSIREEQAADDAKQEHSLDECAQRVLRYIASLDPDWNLLIEGVRDERGFDDKTIVASFCAYVLDNKMHMAVPPHEALQGYDWSTETKACPVCQQEYTMQYPGQPCCLKPECGRALHHNDRVLA